MSIMVVIVSCGPPHAFDDRVGEMANKTRKYLSDRNISSEHVNNLYNDTKDYLSNRETTAREYLYDRGICTIKNGRHCGDQDLPSDGTNGSSGSNGNSGNNGNNGTNGGNGAAGNNGNTGPAGPTGPSGVAGTNGTQGNTGSTGASGTTGTQGTTGTTGATGSTGAAGSNSLALGPARVNLGLAYNFTVFSKAGITNVPGSIIVGDIGTSPITGASIVALDCIAVTGNIYTVDAAGPACRTTNPLYLTTVVADMQTAYTDAAGRVLPNATELGAGQIGGLTIVPGLYKWGTNVLISTDVTLSGGPNDVWIFQIAGNLLQSSATKVKLLGGAQAKNIFWQVAGSATIFTSAHFEGTILSQTLVAMLTGATMNGRLLAQTEITLQSNIINHP